MYVCICNAINDRCVKAAAADGARRPLDVYRASGCNPQCGKCARQIREILRDHSGHQGGTVAPHGLI